MQTINQLLANHPQTLTQKNLQANLPKDTQMNLHQSPQGSAMSISKAQIASMFVGWKRLFGKKMRDNDWQDDTVQVWYIALNDLGMSQDAFSLAKRKSLGLQWPCTAPADFMALVSDGSASKYPDSETVFRFACENEGRTADNKKPYSHVVVYETVKRLGSHALKHADSKYFGIWDKTYTQVIIEFEQGANFTIPESNRIEQKHIPADEKVADDHLAKIKAMLAGAGA